MTCENQFKWIFVAMWHFNRFIIWSNCYLIRSRWFYMEIIYIGTTVAFWDKLVKVMISYQFKKARFCKDAQKQTISRQNYFTFLKSLLHLVLLFQLLACKRFFQILSHNPLLFYFGKLYFSKGFCNFNPMLFLLSI